MTLIAADAVVLDGHVVRPGWVQTDGADIVATGAGRPGTGVDVDLPQSVVVPGFVDMHCHGGGGASYPHRAEEVAAFHRRHGTTSALASLLTAAPADLLAGVRLLAAATAAGTVAGIHLEGPWLSAARCGAHDPALLRAPDPAEIAALLDAGDGAIRMVTLAPELPGADAAIRRLLAADVVVALGHTDAGYDQTRRALDAGATVGTHLFNAMRPVHQREPGPVLALLEDPRATVELIADGVHLHPSLIRRVIDTAGPQRVALVTDAMAAAGCPDGRYRLGGRAVDVADGVARVAGATTIAGSTATAAQLLRTAVAHSALGFDAALSAATQMTATTPARTLRLSRVGALQRGLRADLVVLDRGLQVRRVMVGGRWEPASVGPVST